MVCKNQDARQIIKTTLKPDAWVWSMKETKLADTGQRLWIKHVREEAFQDLVV